MIRYTVVFLPAHFMSHITHAVMAEVSLLQRHCSLAFGSHSKAEHFSGITDHSSQAISRCLHVAESHVVTYAVVSHSQSASRTGYSCKQLQPAGTWYYVQIRLTSSQRNIWRAHCALSSFASSSAVASILIFVPYFSFILLF